MRSNKVRGASRSEYRVTAVAEPWSSDSLRDLRHSSYDWATLRPIDWKSIKVVGESGARSAG